MFITSGLSLRESSHGRAGRHGSARASAIELTAARKHHQGDACGWHQRRTWDSNSIQPPSVAPGAARNAGKSTICGRTPPHPTPHGLMQLCAEFHRSTCGGTGEPPRDPTASGVGARLREWRMRRGTSQLEPAEGAESRSDLGLLSAVVTGSFVRSSQPRKGSAPPRLRAR